MTKRLLRPWYALLILVACGDSSAVWPTETQSEQALAVPEESIVAAVLGDYGVGSLAENRVAQLIRGWQPTFIMTTGDNNYPDGAAATLDHNIGQFYHTYIRFGPQYQGRYRHVGASEQAFFPTLGNHDWHTPHAGPYLRYFDLPGKKRYYTVRRGPLECFMLDSDPHEPDGVTPGSIQGRWLQGALRASSAPWKLVVFHHPPYSTGAHGGSAYMRWPFKAWGATAVLTGHDHHYERIVMQGLPYFVVGTGGAPLRHASGKQPGAQVDIVRTQVHGALKVEAIADVLTMNFYDTDGRRVDGFTVGSAQANELTP